MTEDEARQKWCPMVRYVSGRGEGINRFVGKDGDVQWTPDHSMCIASDCMMWRWVDKQNDDPKMFAVVNGQTEGHCGLAR